MIPAIPLSYASQQLYKDTHPYAPMRSSGRRSERRRRRRLLSTRVHLLPDRWTRPAPHV
jgi:hypothetical protein